MDSHLSTTNVNHRFFLALHSVSPLQRAWAAKRVLELGYHENNGTSSGDGTDVGEGAALLSSSASPIVHHGQRHFYTRLQWHSEVRGRVIAELVEKSKVHVPSFQGLVRLQLHPNAKFLSRTASLDPLTEELKFYHKDKQEGSILLCSIEAVTMNPLRPKEIILLLGMQTTIKLKCTTIEDIEQWREILQRYVSGGGGEGGGGEGEGGGGGGGGGKRKGEGGAQPGAEESYSRVLQHL